MGEPLRSHWYESRTGPGDQVPGFADKVLPTVALPAIIGDPGISCGRTELTAASALTSPAPQSTKQPAIGRADFLMTASIWAGDRSGFADFIRAATLATCGADIEVPSITA